MRIIDRYIVREVLLPFLIFLSIFTFILVIPFLIQYAEAFIAKGVPITVVFGVMATLLPQALALAIPAALLVGLLVAFGRLSSDREFVAMQACGIGRLLTHNVKDFNRFASYITIEPLVPPSGT